MSPPQDTDQADLESLRKGDDLALNRLIERWKNPLMGFAYRYLSNATDAADVVAEVFAKLYQHRLKLRADTHLRAWLFTSAANRCLNHRRWQKRHPSVGIDHPEGDGERAAPSDYLKSEGATPGEAVERGEEIDALRAAVASLPHDFRTPLLLHHYEGMSYREIAVVVGCSERGVETRLYRAKQHLRAVLAKGAGAGGES